MNLEAIIHEVKELGHECVWKLKEECITAPNSVIEAYLRTLLDEREFEMIKTYKEILIDEFRKGAKDELQFLNDKS